MKAINSILVPTDFSPLALNAYRYALRLADALDASIDLMYVVPPISDNPGLGMFVDTQTATLQKKARHELEDFFREGIAGVNSNLSRVPGVETFVKVGDLRSSIRKHVEQEGNQLIVMGTGGRRSGWDDFLGTNASYLANHAPCPVLVIPPNTEYVAIESVCFATDLNDIATFQADKLLLALRPFQPTLNFLHVRSDERKTTDYDLQALREVFDRPGMSLQVDFASRKSEDVVGTVFAYAFETKCDLVVMHHPDRSWFRRLLSKSNTSEAVLHARLPLLIVTTYDSGGQKNSLPRAATQAQRSIALSWDSELLRKMDAYWRAANYLSIGQMYLRDNPLLERALRPSDIKPTLLGHWGTVPGQTFIYVHLNRVIREHDLDMMYISGPGHGGQAMVACAYLEGTYSEIYPAIKQDRAGLQRLFQQYSYPGGIPSHVSPECPGSIHEGGELGYSLSHAFGAVFDNPDLIVACVIGDGEAETGPLATSWHGNKFMNPITDGVVLPILHLNGYKIANPTILARIPEEELRNLLHGYGYLPVFVEGDDPAIMHAKMVDTLDKVVKQIREIQHHARTADDPTRPVWPMIVLRTPKGWTGPEKVDGKLSTGSFHAHQVPIVVKPHDIDQLQQLETWMRSYRPDELFDNKGRLIRELADLAPEGERRMSANPHANGGQLLQPLKMPDYRKYAVEVPTPGTVQAADTNVLGTFLRDIVFLNEEARNFRIFAPDELLSNRLGPVLEATDRQWILPRKSTDEHLAPYGRVVEFLSEHQCQGWLEGYLLTGRHGLFTSYEAFIHIVDSMVSQHAKWLKVTAELLWRAPIASLNYLLASHVWQQAHNGFTHQDPGFIDHVVNKKAAVVRVYLPPDANCLLSVWDHCQRSKHYINVVVAGKYQAPQWLNIREAEDHCARGIGVWHWASCPADTEPDLVMACCGDVPTLETLAAVKIFKSALPKLKIRVVNVVDLMKLQSPEAHPHGLSDTEFDALFTSDKPVVFAFHGYPFLIHRLTYKRANHANLHVHGYREEGTITTAFDMTVLNELDRFHLVRSALKHLPDTGPDGDALALRMLEKHTQHKLHIQAYGVDLPEVRNWSWPLTPQTAFV